MLDIHMDGAEGCAWPSSVQKPIHEFGEFGGRVSVADRVHLLPVSNADVLSVIVKQTPSRFSERRIYKQARTLVGGHYSGCGL